jgi:uncharacterized damage-inducible protein DinB
MRLMLAGPVSHNSCMNDWLADGFRYNLWANRVWAEALGSFDDPSPVFIPGPWPDFPKGDPLERARDVYLHILFAERIWLDRCGGSVALEGGPTEWTQELCDAWIAQLSDHALDERIDYHNTLGAPQHKTFGEIVAHVLRHGAYHRGQLREIFEAIRPDDSPQT